MDDSLITPLNKGVDHFNYTEGACPGPAPEGEVLVPETQSRYEDEDQDDAEVTRQIGLYSGYMKTISQHVCLDADDFPLHYEVAHVAHCCLVLCTVLMRASSHSLARRRCPARLEDWSQSHDTNFYASHRPLFAVACDGDHMNVLDWTMQQSLGPHTLDRVSAAIAGHSARPPPTRTAPFFRTVRIDSPRTHHQYASLFHCLAALSLLDKAAR
eukprot:274502-Pleurochrysis_carterae.AAC.2